MGPESRHLWDRAAERMEAIHRMLARDGGQLVLVVVPMMRHLVEPGYFDAADFWRPWAEAQRALPGSQPVIVIDPIPRFAELQRELAAELVAADIASVETVRPELLEPGADGAEPIDLPDLRALAHREQSLFNLRDLVHFTARGHHAFGQQVYRGLRDAGILDPR
jgi:hypothetical protein